MRKAISFLVVGFAGGALVAALTAQTAPEVPLAGEAGQTLAFPEDISRFSGTLHEGFRLVGGSSGFAAVRHVGHFEGQGSNAPRGFRYQVNQFNTADCMFCAGFLDFTGVAANGDAPTTAWNCMRGTAAGQMITVNLAKTNNPNEHAEAVVAQFCHSGATFIHDRVRELR